MVDLLANLIDDISLLRCLQYFAMMVLVADFEEDSCCGGFTLTRLIRCFDLTAINLCQAYLDEVVVHGIFMFVDTFTFDSDW